MSNLIPGKIVREFTAKNGKNAVIRYPKWEDLEDMVGYINEVSKEDTFITFSGETINKDGEMYYLSEMFKGMELQNNIYLACFIDNTLVGTCTVMRDLQSRKRSYHVGIFGVTIAKDFRGIGIGETISKCTIDEARKNINGLKMLTLNVFSPNTVAKNLYKKLGFVEYAKLPKGVWFKNDYIDEIKMYLPL